MSDRLKEQVNKLHLLVVGDVMIDKYTVGSVSRMSPEAPVSILDKKDQFERLGGAANVALNLRELGADVSLISCVGNDAQGKALKEKLENENIHCELVTDETRRTTIKERFMSEDGHLLRVDTEDTHPMLDALESKFIGRLHAYVKDQSITGVVISDYNKGLLSKKIIRELIELATEANIPTYVDPKYHNYWEYKGCTMFKPNKKELEGASPKQERFDVNMKETIRKLGCDMIICTRSSEGISYVEKEEVHTIPTDTRSVVDVSGAGDTALAVITVLHQVGYSTHEICMITNRAGGHVCQSMGVVPLKLETLLEMVKSVKGH